MTPYEAVSLVQNEKIESIDSLELLVGLVVDEQIKLHYQERIKVFKSYVVYKSELECQSFIKLDFFGAVNTLLFTYNVRELSAVFCMRESE